MFTFICLKITFDVRFRDAFLRIVPMHLFLGVQMITQDMLHSCTDSHYSLTIGEFGCAAEDTTTYRFYTDLSVEDDLTTAVFGAVDLPLTLASDSRFFIYLVGDVVGLNVNSTLMPFFPEVAAGSWARIGEVSFEDRGVPQFDQCSAQSLITASAHSLANFCWVLVMQFITAKVFDGTLNLPLSPHSNADVEWIHSFAFVGEGTHPQARTPMCGCANQTIENFFLPVDCDDGYCVS